MDMKTLIFFLPLPIAVAVAWHCRRRGVRFSRWFVYVLPFCLPVVSSIVQIKFGMDPTSLLLGEKGIKLLSLLFGNSLFVAPYLGAIVTSGVTMLAGKISTSVHNLLGSLSFFALYCLHAGMLVLSFVFSLFLMIGASPDVGLF